MGYWETALTLSSPTLLPVRSTSWLQCDQLPQSCSPSPSQTPLKLQSQNKHLPSFLKWFLVRYSVTKTGREKDPGALEAGAPAEPLTRAGPQHSLMLPGKLPFVKKTKEQTHSMAFKLWQFLSQDKGGRKDQMHPITNVAVFHGSCLDRWLLRRLRGVCLRAP